MTNPLLSPTLEADNILWSQLHRAMDEDDRIALLRLVQEAHAADIAEALSALETSEIVKAMRTILLGGEIGVAAEILNELEPRVIAELDDHLDRHEWAWLLRELSDDEMVNILDVLPDETSGQLLRKMPTQDQEGVQILMNYPEDSAGRIMTTEFIAMDSGASVGAVTERIRNETDIDVTNLFFVYVTENSKLVGEVSLRRLLISQDSALLKDIMNGDIVRIPVDMDQEEVAEIVRRHDEVTVPVVDEEDRVLGIITVDDVIDVIDEESEEDILKAVGASDEELLVANRVRKIVALRLPWIMAALAGSLLVAFVMKYSEGGVFGEMAGKIFIFVPMICAMGGNVGVQSATIMARLLTTGNPDWREARRAVWKEARVGLSLGLICGGLVGGFAAVWGGVAMLATVMTAMVCSMTSAAITGTLIPIIMKRMGIDPALATGPFVTSFNDLMATIVYFLVAASFLEQLAAF